MYTAYILALVGQAVGYRGANTGPRGVDTPGCYSVVDCERVWEQVTNTSGGCIAYVKPTFGKSAPELLGTSYPGDMRGTVLRKDWPSNIL
jgi:hypothetical protein